MASVVVQKGWDRLLRPSLSSALATLWIKNLDSTSFSIARFVSNVDVHNVAVFPKELDQHVEMRANSDLACSGYSLAELEFVYIYIYYTHIYTHYAHTHIYIYIRMCICIYIYIDIYQ
jgi:hypothetical protein